MNTCEACGQECQGEFCEDCMEGSPNAEQVASDEAILSNQP